MIQSTGGLAQAGTVDLGAATRTFTISNGTPSVDVSILAAVTGTGGITKAGAGTLQLSAPILTPVEQPWPLVCCLSQALPPSSAPAT